MNIQERDFLIVEWRDVQVQLATLRERERTLRDKIVENVFDASIVEGSETLELGQGYKLKVAKKLNYSVRGTQMEILNAVSCLSADVQSRLIKWKPSLSLPEFRRLEGDQLRSVESVVETKPGAPTLTLVEPKSK